MQRQWWLQETWLQRWLGPPWWVRPHRVRRQWWSQLQRWLEPPWWVRQRRVRRQRWLPETWLRRWQGLQWLEPPWWALLWQVRPHLGRRRVQGRLRARWLGLQRLAQPRSREQQQWPVQQ
jgi:hypothetical protein